MTATRHPHHMNEGITHLECHAFRHDWDEISFLRAPSYGIAQDWRCTMCLGVKRELWSRHGVFISRRYLMPDDYKSPPGMSKADYRKVWFDQKLKKLKNGDHDDA
jgi:hypothetical protein